MPYDPAEPQAQLLSTITAGVFCVQLLLPPPPLPATAAGTRARVSAVRTARMTLAAGFLVICMLLKVSWTRRQSSLVALRIDSRNRGGIPHRGDPPPDGLTIGRVERHTRAIRKGLFRSSRESRSFRRCARGVEAPSGLIEPARQCRLQRLSRRSSSESSPRSSTTPARSERRAFRAKHSARTDCLEIRESPRANSNRGHLHYEC